METPTLSSFADRWLSFFNPTTHGFGGACKVAALCIPNRPVYTAFMVL